MKKDLIVIGGGPGGYVAAIRAAQLGAKVTLIEQDKLGGTCLHQGCIPTKALYKNAEILNSLRGISDFGISLRTGYDFDLPTAQLRKQEVINRLQTGIEQLLQSNGVQVIKATARLVNPTTVEIMDSDTKPDAVKDRVQAHAILLATGSKAGLLPVPGVDLPGVLTSQEALALDHIPKSMTIIGGGVVGIEFAGIFQSFGTQVTVLELLPRILPAVDVEIVRRLTPLLKKKGIQVVTGVKVREILMENGNLKVLTQGKENSEGASYLGERVLLSAGRSANIHALNLAEVGIDYDRNGIKVDSHYQTSLPGVYAIGDVIGGKMLAHVASEQGKSVAENLFSASSQACGSQVQATTLVPTQAVVLDDAIPSCIFSFPEIATVGLTEEEAKDRGIPYRVSKFMFAANGKALTLGETDGLVKVIAEEQSKRVIGVHILGPHASDLIHEATLAITHRLTVEDIIHVVHAHPTLGESFHEAILGLDNQAIHMAPKR